MKRLLSLLGLVLTVALSSHAAYYIVGSDPFGGWNPASGMEMTKQSDGTYSCEVRIDGTVWFVFADGLSSDWSVFNSTYRIGPLNGDETVQLGTYYTTQRAGDSGAYKFVGESWIGLDLRYTITLDPSTWKFIIEEITYPIPMDSYTVAGNSEALFGTLWDQTNTANDMEKLDEWTFCWKKDKVALGKGSFEFKVVANHDWGWSYPLENNYYVEVPKAGNYDVEIRFNLLTKEITCSITLVAPSLHGDLNGDGEVNLADINVLIDAILAGNMNMEYDVNGDCEINIADVSALIDVLLSPPPAPTEMTAAPIFNGYYIDGIFAFFVELTPTEPSTIYSRVLYPDGIYSAWEEYTDLLSFTDNGNYRVEAYAIAPGKLQSDFVAYEFDVYFPKTSEPTISTQLTDEAVIITAIGAGEVRLYINNIEVENPYYIERGEVDMEVEVKATAQWDYDWLVSDPVIMWITIPAKEKPNEVTPSPEIYVELTDDAAIISAVGEGEILLYIDGTEVDNPFYYERGEEDVEILISATAQGEGMLISEPTYMEFAVPAKENVGPDPHLNGFWLVLYDRYGEELWYELLYDGYNGYTTVVPLHYAVFGDVDENGERVKVPFHFVVDGIHYGPYDDRTTPVYGTALDNPLFEGSNNFVAPVGYAYTVGIIDDGDDNFYLMIVQGYPLPQY